LADRVLEADSAPLREVQDDRTAESVGHAGDSHVVGVARRA
jgi:hypothetical protein